MESPQKALTHIPHEPGVYLYRNAEGQVIYVGKARDLLNRVRQYFRRDDALGSKTKNLVAEIASIETIPTTSEFDALLLEAKLIHTYLPKYNAAVRDDKSPLYAVFTLSETYPRLLLVRKGEVPLYEKGRRNAIYGPFQSGYTLRMTLRHLRHIVPYCTQKERRGTSCFYTHLGLCDPCPSVIVHMNEEPRVQATKRYRINMLRLRALFEGKTRWLASEYESEMRHLAKIREYEQAARIRERLKALNSLSSHRYDPQVYLDHSAQDIYDEELEELLRIMKRYYPTLTRLTRIECYDISHLSGTHTVGSMVVLESGKPEKAAYRRFRVKRVRGISDVASLAEVLKRRLKHSEWPYPDFLLVDGGKPQVATAVAILSERRQVKGSPPSIPIAGLAKREEELIIPKAESGFVTLRLPLSGRAIKVVQRIRDEAHRFAVSYHTLLRQKAFLGTIQRSHEVSAAGISLQ